MSTTCESAQDLLADLTLPTNFSFEEQDEDDLLAELEFQMTLESSLYDDGSLSEDEDMEIRSLIQLPGSSTNSTVWVHTKTGRRAKIILEAEDESENVGLLQYEDSSQEIRRMESYATKSSSGVTSTPRKICRVDTLTIPNNGGARLPSLRVGKNPFFDPLESELTQSPSAVPHYPSCRAGKNPHFSPSAECF